MTPNTYTYPATGETVEREPWRWVAVYADGTTLEQFDNIGTFHRFAEIDQSKVTTFKMVHDSLPAVVLLMPEGCDKLIHFYRKGRLDYMGEGGGTPFRMYCFGYEKAGINHYYVIAPDDSVIATDDFNRVKLS